MSLLIFRRYDCERYEIDDDGYVTEDEDGEPIEPIKSTESRFVAEVPDLQHARQRIEAETIVVEPSPPGPSDVPTNRFSVYEPSDDTDGDGFPDSYTFVDLYTATPPPEPETATVRKGQRAKA